MTVEFLRVGRNRTVVDPLMPLSVTVYGTDCPDSITLTGGQAVPKASVD